MTDNKLLTKEEFQFFIDGVLKTFGQFCFTNNYSLATAEFYKDIQQKFVYIFENIENDTHIICDKTNNTPEIIDRNALAIDVYCKFDDRYHKYQIEFSTTSLSFQELVYGI